MSVFRGTVHSIKSYTFSGCSGLEELQIHDNVEEIGEGAFSGCEGLKKVTMPLSCRYYLSASAYSHSTFQNCANVEEIVYTAGNGSVFEAGNQYSLPAYSKAALKKASFAEGITALPSYALNNCYAVTEVSLPNTLTTIGDFAFSGCGALTILEFEGDAPSFGHNCFNGIVADVYYKPDNDGWLEDNVLQNYGGTITWIPYKVEVILNYKDVDLFVSDHPFGNSVHIEATVNGYDGENVLIWSSSDDTIVRIEDGKITGLREGTAWITATFNEDTYAQCRVEVISDVPFMCPPIGTKLIEEEAFSCASALKAVVLNDQIESIGANAFAGCVNLTIINIPASVMNIAENAFADCPNLRIYCTTDGIGERYAIETGIPYELIDSH